MRDGGFCLSIPPGKGTSLVGRYLCRGTSSPFICFFTGDCLWVWLLRWPTVSLPVLHEAVKCLQWLQCVSQDRETGREPQRGGFWALQDEELQGEVTGESTVWIKQESQIKQTGKEIALLPAKETVCGTYYFSTASISARFLFHSPATILFPSPSLPDTQVWTVKKVTKGLQAPCFLWTRLARLNNLFAFVLFFFGGSPDIIIDIFIW